MVDLIFAPIFWPWWGQLFAWVAGAWVISTMLMRFGYRECPTWVYKMSESYPPRRIRAKLTNSECKERFPRHAHHVFARDYAWIVGALWPLLIFIAIPAALVTGYFYSSAKLGRAEWIKELEMETRGVDEDVA